VKSPNLFSELKRRNVIRMTGLYLVGAWLVVQVAGTVLPMFGAPEWLPRTIVVLLAIGFVPAVIFSWVFEITPEGLKREEDVARDRSITPQNGRLMDRMIIAVLVLALGYFAFDKFVLTPRREAALVASAVPNDSKSVINAKSIAVMPFENRSRDPDNAYFAYGIQDEILTRLAKIADLKVISRTSTQHYKSAPENLPEIAKELGVAHILEGSVQKAGDAVRVNVQLIKAADDSHLWADTFDRKLTDIFSVESEVAKAIADQLRVKLTGQEEQVIDAKPTDNPQAYDAYLRGLAYTRKIGNTQANFLGAQRYLREAVRLDPKFALAWALLSDVDSRGYVTQALQPTLALREEARQAAETALTLQPNLGEALLAKGNYYYACLKDYDTAVRYFEQARQFLPNSGRIPQSLAYVARRRGEWDLSESYFKEAERLDPRNVYLLSSQAGSYIMLRRFPEALRKLEQVLNITPDDVDTIVTKAGIAQAEGDLPRASALLAPLRPAADLHQIHAKAPHHDARTAELRQLEGIDYQEITFYDVPDDGVHDMLARARPK